jgi:glutamate--cysteine ligase
MKLPLSDDVAKRYAVEAEESIVEQRRIEGADTLPFETYRQLYLAPVRLKE